jgi:uroporphyrinogen decarboxylase
MEYTSYERVLSALQHKEPDRIPFDLGATAVTAINMNALRNLKRYLSIPGEVTLWDKITQVAMTDKETSARLRVDVGRVGPNAPFNPNYAIDLDLVGDHYRLIDE